MGSQPETTPPSEPTPPPALSPVDDRRRRWNRITWIIVIATLVLWGTALVFHREIRVNYWAWRASRADTDTARSTWVNQLIAAGPRSIGPAIRLTRSDRESVRLAGLNVLVGLIDAKAAERSQQAREIRRSFSTADEPTLRQRLAELNRPLDIDPAVLARVRELIDLGDEWEDVIARAIDGVVHANDRSAADPLEALALRVEVATGAGAEATQAVDGLLGEKAAVPRLARILAGAKSPAVRSQAAECLRMHRTAASMNALLKALTDLDVVDEMDEPESLLDNPEVRLLVQKELARLGLPPASQPATRPTSAPAEMTVADYAARALETLTGKELGYISSRAPAEREQVIARWKAAVDGAQAGEPVPHGD